MAESPPDRVTELVRRLGDGDESVAEELLPLVYDELRAVAHRLFVLRPAGNTLQPTAILHEAWMKLAAHGGAWNGRSHFFSVASRAMRQVLADHVRAKRTERRGKEWQRVTFHDPPGGVEYTYDIADLEDALQRLAAANERHARVVELRLFAGLTVDEVANLLGVTPRTIKLDWRSARAWLKHELGGRRES